MQKIFGANWLPKVVAFIGGLLTAGVTAWQDGTLLLTPKNIISFLVITALGFVVKGHNVTGIGDKATTDPAKDATAPTTIAKVAGGTTIP